MSGLFDWVIRAAIENRVAVLLLAIALTVAGLWQLQQARLDALPSFTPPTVTVQAEAPGHGSTEVARQVATPLERSLQGTPGLSLIRSTSRPGLAIVSLTFDEGTDIFRARQLVSERLARGRDQLPASMPQPQLGPIVSPVGALVKLTYTTSDDGPEAFGDLSRFVLWRLAPALLAIEGVARVTVHGAESPRIEVQPDTEKMLAHGVSLGALRSVLGHAQGLTPPGYVQAGDQRISLRAETRWTLRDLDRIASTVIEQQRGLPVRIADVATVALGHAPPVGHAIQDGQRAIYVQIDKLPWADTLALTRNVERTLGHLDRQLPAGGRRQAPMFRQADFIHTSLWSVGRAMLLGAVLIICTLLAFLRSGRVAAISLVALPLSLLAAVAVLLLRGASINGMVLGGLAIAVGEVVDDAIVDVENIWRRLKDNAALASPRPLLQVIHDASVEVRGAVVYASMIVVVVLLPVLVMGGLAGRIFSPLAEAYALAVLASLAVALTVTPAMSAVLLRGVPARALDEGALSRRAGQLYAALLARVRRRPGSVLLLTLIVALLSLGSLPFLGGGFLPEFREGVLIASIDAWPGSSLAETTRLARRIGAALRTRGQLPHVAARVGRASLDDDAAPVHRIEMDLELPPGNGEPEEAAAPLLRSLSSVPGIRFAIDGFLGERINELLAGERAPMALELSGQDQVTLRDLAATLVDELGQVPGVERVRCSDLVDAPTTELLPDGAALALAGAVPADLVDAVAVHRQGLAAASLTGPAGFRLPVVIHAAGAGASVAAADVPIWSAGRGPWVMSMLSRAVATSEPAAIHHEGGTPVVTVTIWPRSEQLMSVARRVAEVLRTTALPASVRWHLAGQAAERARASGRLVAVALGVLAAIFVFLWLAFRSAVDALVVVVGIPIGLAGGLLAALLLPDGMSLAAMVGFVTLTGIISRNGIMLVAHKNHLLAEHPGEDRAALIMRAARDRLRPILMTAAAALGGLLPLALSMEAAGSELEAPMALIVCGGLITSTALNLLAVPAFYLWALRRSRQEST